MPREQDQFLDVVDRDTAEARWWAAIRPEVLASERVALGQLLGRVLAEDVFAEVDVPAFDRSNVDGYAVRAEETLRRLGGRPSNLPVQCRGDRDRDGPSDDGRAGHGLADRDRERCSLEGPTRS